MGDVLETNIEGLNLCKRGKVRDVYDLGDQFLIVSTDRLSAFDCILPDAIPRKGEVLTKLAAFWFEQTKDIIDNHIISLDVADFPAAAQHAADILTGRTCLVKKAEMIPIECIVRGYIVGSGWKDYENTGSVCGYKLPAGLKQAEKLPEVLFTPSTKAEEGHDENISVAQMNNIVGEDIGKQLMEASIAVYKKACAHAESRGIILADTKFEFGMVDGKMILIDEILTPDSSRFWPKDQYQPGMSPPSFDKQFVRDYLETLDWDKTPPAPKLPAEVVAKTSQKYLEAYERLTGSTL